MLMQRGLRNSVVLRSTHGALFASAGACASMEIDRKSRKSGPFRKAGCKHGTRSSLSCHYPSPGQRSKSLECVHDEQANRVPTARLDDVWCDPGYALALDFLPRPDSLPRSRLAGRRAIANHSSGSGPRADHPSAAAGLDPQRRLLGNLFNDRRLSHADAQLLILPRCRNQWCQRQDRW